LQQNLGVGEGQEASKCEQIVNEHFAVGAARYEQRVHVGDAARSDGANAGCVAVVANFMVAATGLKVKASHDGAGLHEIVMRAHCAEGSCSLADVN
jgi:hypothetical protein